MSTHRDIVHLDLSRSPSSLAALASPDRAERGALMVLWWRDVPLGQLEIEASELPIDAAELAALILPAIAPALDAYLAGDRLRSRRRHLERPAGEAEAPRRLRAALSLLDGLPGIRQPAVGAATPTISVIVPTRDRPNHLAACLRSLAALNRRPLEVIVVDNAPADDGRPSKTTLQVVAGAAGVRCIAEPRRGSSAARNAGVAAGRGELIAFVDDDETVHPAWLGRLADCFHDPAIGLVTGLVLPAELETEAQLIFEQRYSFSRGYVARTFGPDLYRATRRRGVPVWEIGGSGNMAIRRDVFQRLAGFDERLGAGRAGGCEELELFYRALAAGWSCRYEPRAVTHHRHRRDMASLTRQLNAYMRGHVASALTQWAGHRDPGNLRHLLWTLPKVYSGYSLRCLLGDRRYRGSHLAAEIAGCLSGVGYYRRHRSQNPRPEPNKHAAVEDLDRTNTGALAA